MNQIEPNAYAPHGQEHVVAAVPRVNIAMFCTTQATASALQQVAIDRRMARAHVDIQYGGIMQAVQVYSQSSTPDVLILETEGYRDQVLSELSQLANVCSPNTKVILIGHVNDVILYRELIRQGLSEYLVAPVHQLQVIDAISSLYNDPEAAPIGRIVAFVGSKGGVGSSTIAHNIAAIASGEFQVDTIITDLRHRRPELQPGPGAGHGGSHQLVRPHRRHHDRAASDQVHRPVEPAVGAGAGGEGVGHGHRYA